MLKVMPVGFVCFNFSKKREVAPINKAGKDEKHFFFYLALTSSLLHT